MKISSQDRIRKLTSWPETMNDFRRQVTKQFAEPRIFEACDSQQLRMSTLSTSKDQLMSFISQASQRQTSSIVWHESIVCYEDSENDLNVISDDEDLQTAKLYSQSKFNKYL
jgi:hypothetical protein